MLRKLLMVLITALCAIAGPVAMAADAPAVTPILEPSTPWQVDYADSECRLLRTFGTGERAITLRIARGGSPGAVDMVIAGPKIPKLSRSIPLTIALQPQGTEQKVDAYSLAIPKVPGRFVRWFDTDLAFLDTLKEDQIIGFHAGPRFAPRLHLTSAVSAMKALEACYSDLLKGWGVEPADVSEMIATRQLLPASGSQVTAYRIDLPKPKTNPAAWVTFNDYPTAALVAEQGGDVTVLLQLTASGRPEGCRVVVSSKVESLDRATCVALSSRARYVAPLDAAGNPRKSAITHRVRWVIPQG
ncbi:MAG: TonB family protein [Novosphingobium sp.]